MAEITLNGIKYSNVNVDQPIVSNGFKNSRAEFVNNNDKIDTTILTNIYNAVDNGNIQWSNMAFVNALEIDWNGAELVNSDNSISRINTTSDLIKIIKTLEQRITALEAPGPQPTVSLTFNNNGGSLAAPSMMQGTAGHEITLPSYSGSKSGYIAVGWNTKSDGSGTSYGFGGSFTLSMSINTLYVDWQSQPNITLSFNANGGNTAAPSPIQRTAGETITLPTYNGTKSGYNNIGWNTQPDGNGTHFNAGSTFTFTMTITTLYVDWVVNTTPTLNSIAWKTTTGSSTAGTQVTTSTVTNKITATWSNGTTTEVDEVTILVYSNAECTTTVISTWYNTAGTYYIKGIYNNKTTTNYITWIVSPAVLNSIAWKTTTGSSTAGTQVTTSTVTNKITATWSNGTTTEVNEASIIVYSNATCTTTAGATWYNTAGTYYIKGTYNSKTTTNYITWTVNPSQTYYWYLGYDQDLYDNTESSKSKMLTLTTNEVPTSYTRTSGNMFYLNGTTPNYIIMVIPTTWTTPSIGNPAGGVINLGKEKSSISISGISGITFDVYSTTSNNCIIRDVYIN